MRYHAVQRQMVTKVVTKDYGGRGEIELGGRVKVTVKQVEKIIRDAKPGLTSVGQGLGIRITPDGYAYWIFRFTFGGKRRLMNLSSCEDVGLADARDLAYAARSKVKQGIDPLQARQTQAVEAQNNTFRQLALNFIELRKSGWRNAKHAQQWQNTLTQYAFKQIGDLPIQSVDTAKVLSVLKPIWSKVPETANRVRNRIELVIDAARAQGLYIGQNPAAWRGHLDKLLPKRSRLERQHHPALDYHDLPKFYAELTQDRKSVSATALAVTILTACRTSEVLLADWSEVDLENKLWTIPSNRMKAGRPHRVALSDEVVSLLEALPSREGYLFPSKGESRPLSNMAMTMCLRKLGREDITVHGFRSTFRDWAAEETHYQNHICEMALSHTVSSAVEAAYRRGDLLDKRRALMQDWANYATTQRKDNVVEFRGAA